LSSIGHNGFTYNFEYDVFGVSGIFIPNFRICALRGKGETHGKSGVFKLNDTPF